ncbi:hypothetical protein Bca101_058732 [Brassica carinata]
MVLIFHLDMFFRSGYAGFSDLEDFWDDLPISLLDDFQESSRRLPGSRLDFLEVVWTSCKSSGLPVSRLDFL